MDFVEEEAKETAEHWIGSPDCRHAHMMQTSLERKAARLVDSPREVWPAWWHGNGEMPDGVLHLPAVVSD